MCVWRIMKTNIVGRHRHSSLRLLILSIKSKWYRLVSESGRPVCLPDSETSLPMPWQYHLLSLIEHAFTFHAIVDFKQGQKILIIPVLQQICNEIFTRFSFTTKNQNHWRDSHCFCWQRRCGDAPRRTCTAIYWPTGYRMLPSADQPSVS